MSRNGFSDLPDTIRQTLLDSYLADAQRISAQLDRLAALAAKLCHAPIGLVSLVAGDREVFIGRSGTHLAHFPREHSFCAIALREPGGMVVVDAAADDRFHDNPLVIGDPFIRFYAGQPLVSDEHVLLGSLCVIDSEPRAAFGDEQRQVLETLAEAAVALLERWRWREGGGLRGGAGRDAPAELDPGFQVLADAMPQLVWSTSPDGMADYFNRVWCEFTGQPAEASYGEHWTSFLHEQDREAAERCWTQAVTTGSDYEIEYRLRHRDGEYRWVLARGTALRDGDGEIARWIGTCTDIHEQKANAERLEVLSRELNHRIKNIFAVIGGLIAITVRSKPEFSDHAIELRDRVLALGRAHDFVRSRGGTSSPNPHTRLSGLLEALLAPYQDSDKQRITIIGDELAIDDRSATPLALFFHELATNAAKYGALSEDGGRVEICVRQAEEVELTWRESGGPPVRHPVDQGFGSSLVEMSIGRQLGGTLEYDWREDGLHVTARIRAEVLAR